MYKKILVINLMYIGDLLFTTPLLHVLRAKFPEAHIAMLVDSKNAGVVNDNHHLSELIPMDKKGYHNKFSNYTQLIRDIRKRNFDLVINLHGNERATAIAAFSGGKTIIGFAARGFGVFFDKLVKESIDIHQADAYLEVLKTINLSNLDHNGLEMWVDEDSQEKAEEIWQEAFAVSASTAKNNLPVIGLNTGGSWPTKRWTKAGFAKLADRLLEDGYGIAVFGGPMDVQDVNEILTLMKHKESERIAVFTGKVTLSQMAALVKKCEVLVTGDSGPMHIAVSQKVKIVALFGPSNPIRYAPYGQKMAVIQSSQNCLCCGQHSCDHRRCMNDIGHEQVYSAVLKRLEIQ